MSLQTKIILVALRLVTALAISLGAWVFATQAELAVSRRLHEEYEEHLDFHGDILTEHERKAEWFRDQLNMMRHEAGLPPVSYPGG